MAVKNDSKIKEITKEKGTKPTKETKVTKETKTTDDKIQEEMMNQLKEIKKMQLELLETKKEIDKEKELLRKEKESLENNSHNYVASNEFIEVICNIPKFEVSDLPAYDLGTKGSTRFIGMPKYGSKASIQYSKLQEILGYQDSGLIATSILIGKNNKNAIKDLGLSEIYEHIVYPEDMDEFFDSSVKEIENVITGCPTRMVDSIVAVARKKMNNGTLDCSVAKLRKLEELLNTKI